MKAIINKRSEWFAVQFDIAGLEELLSDPAEMVFELRSMNEFYSKKIDMDNLKSIIDAAIKIKKAEVK